MINVQNNNEKTFKIVMNKNVNNNRNIGSWFSQTFYLNVCLRDSDPQIVFCSWRKLSSLEILL